MHASTAAPARAATTRGSRIHRGCVSGAVEASTVAAGAADGFGVSKTRHGADGWSKWGLVRRDQASGAKKNVPSVGALRRTERQLGIYRGVLIADLFEPLPGDPS